MANKKKLVHETHSQFSSMHNIAVIANSFYGDFERKLMRSIENAVGFKPYNINYFSTKGLTENFEEIFRRVYYGKMADGIISFGITPSEALLAEFQNYLFPITVIEGKLENKHIDIITIDDRTGGFFAGDYLCKRGRKKIAVVTGKPYHIHTLTERVEGFKSALESHGLKINRANYVELPLFTFDEGRKVYRDVFSKMAGSFDAIFCACGDMVAVGIIAEARKLGQNVPGDFSVMGFDDVEAASFSFPPLTTIKQPIDEMGRRAAENIMHKIKRHEPASGEKVICSAHLVERESV